MGEFVARNMLGWFEKINKRKSCCILLVVYIVLFRHCLTNKFQCAFRIHLFSNSLHQNLRQMLQVSQDCTELRKCLWQPILDSRGIIFLSKCPWRQSLLFKELYWWLASWVSWWISRKALSDCLQALLPARRSWITRPGPSVAITQPYEECLSAKTNSTDSISSAEVNQEDPTEKYFKLFHTGGIAWRMTSQEVLHNC
jgi:hypothetical protein